MKNNLTSLLEREMDRREFIILIGTLLLAVTGISGLLRSTSHVLEPVKKTSKGFGSRGYGQ